MHCTGTYQAVSNVSADVCVQRCTTDAKCKSVVYYFPEKSREVPQCYLKSTAEMCASPGYTNLWSDCDFYIKI